MRAERRRKLDFAMSLVGNQVGVDAASVATGSDEIEAAGERLPARASLKPLYDPKSEKVTL